MLLVSTIYVVVYTFNKPTGIGLIVLSTLVDLGSVLHWRASPCGHSRKPYYRRRLSGPPLFE